MGTMVAENSEVEKSEEEIVREITGNFGFECLTNNQASVCRMQFD